MFSQMIAFGRLTRDPELRYVNGHEGQVAVCNITIACDDRSRSGETKTGFLDFVFWARQAEIIADCLKKGDPIFAVGSARTEMWMKNGERQYRLKFRGREFKLVPRVATRASVEGKGDSSAPPTSENYPEADDIPF